MGQSHIVGCCEDIQKIPTTTVPGHGNGSKSVHVAKPSTPSTTTPRPSRQSSKEATKGGSKTSPREKGRREKRGRIGADKFVSNASEGVEKALLAHSCDKSQTKEDVALIVSALKQNNITSKLEEKDLHDLAKLMSFFTFEKGQFVCRQDAPGSTFFVLYEGEAEVVVNGSVVNKLSRGMAFGEKSLIHDYPRSASVIAKTPASLWGLGRTAFREALKKSAMQHYANNRAFLDSVKLLDGFTSAQKDRLGQVVVTEGYKAGDRVVMKGEVGHSMYFVKTGRLSVLLEGTAEAKASGVPLANKELGPGECFGERALLHDEPRSATVEALTVSELLCIDRKHLQEVLGEMNPLLLLHNFLMMGLKGSRVFSHFSFAQQLKIVQAFQLCEYKENAEITDKTIRFFIVLDGEVRVRLPTSLQNVLLTRGQCFGDHTVQEMSENMPELKTGSKDCSLAVITATGLKAVLKTLGIGEKNGDLGLKLDHQVKMTTIRAVPILRHLSDRQVDLVVDGLSGQKLQKGAQVVVQGEVGTRFFVISQGEVRVLIDGKQVRTLGKNDYFGERALLFDEPRTATIEVVSPQLELWALDKKVFHTVVEGKMEDDLKNRIKLQDTTVDLSDLTVIRVVGQGTMGTVEMVKHKKTGTRYALKRVEKTPDALQAIQDERDILQENDHPFIVKMVKSFDAKTTVSFLMELVTGGELFDVLRQLPGSLDRRQSQFYTGSILLGLDSLHARHILYRDLKPENVMCDHQGYLKLIDFGCAKKVTGRTFTLLGTPHYMAPEVIQGSGYGHEVDIWSLGVMLYEFICTVLPFGNECDEPIDVCQAVLSKPLIFPPSCKDEVAKELMTKQLNKKPADRLGCGLEKSEAIKQHPFFFLEGQGRMVPSDSRKDTLFDLLMGRQLEPPYVPKGERYCSDNPNS